MSSTTSASNGALQSGGSKVSSPSTSSIPQSAPAGLLSMTQPPQASTSFFKIASGEVVTFAWSFSGVLATPTSLTVNAVGANSFTYSLTSLPGTASSYIWTPYDYQQSHLATPLAQTTYTLEIFDERGLGATIRPGYLSPNTALTFALYTPQPYTPLASWQCTVCSGSNSSFTAHPAYVALIATFLVMFLSGFGLLRNAVAYTRR
ncbi:uncharacterized protein C8R40DRAFT_1038779 [Lentinula edodes]|uniref:uncharacterized protein n=1 Tax=Lentinula edodes TaxID=5353 RepID=UPI001E8E81AB|nr:uncharacterized protein C8R40DRAFT_1038779 [Lentinula edodes]KAH7878222.1 hypothetical protein C8R40DRAFT_1038779 [Lentinula edodes]KAJ3917242.1 hypothetical protein F5877DRAFT_45016 [Lentinula edodes]